MSSQYLRAASVSDMETTNIEFDDPMVDIILVANELAFRTAYTASNTLSEDTMYEINQFNLTSEQPYIISPNLTLVNRTLHQRSLVRDSSLQTVYDVQNGWLTGGSAVMVLACLAILPTYWGWWHLGREVSMSPLEIARAFEAPIMRDTDPNATGDDLKKRGRWGSLTCAC